MVCECNLVAISLEVLESSVTEHGEFDQSLVFGAVQTTHLSLQVLELQQQCIAFLHSDRSTLSTTRTAQTGGCSGYFTGTRAPPAPVVMSFTPPAS